MDRYLDQARTGPRFLLRVDVAALVKDCLLQGVQLGRYELAAFVIMANHVHALMRPLVPASRLLGSLKGYTAFQANRLLGRTGAFWQRESYDHWVRDQDEFERIVGYIENNPVTVGIVSSDGGVSMV